MSKIPNRARALEQLLAGVSMARFMELNNEVWAPKFKTLRSLDQEEKRELLSKGVVVKFTVSRGRGGKQKSVVHGVIEKVMKSRAACQEIDETGKRIPGRTWRVSLSMLEKSERSELR